MATGRDEGQQQNTEWEATCRVGAAAGKGVEAAAGGALVGSQPMMSLMYSRSYWKVGSLHSDSAACSSPSPLASHSCVSCNMTSERWLILLRLMHVERGTRYDGLWDVHICIRPENAWEADLLHAQLSGLAEAGDGGRAVVGLLEQRHDGLHRARDANQPAVDQRRKSLRLQPDTV